MALGIEKGRLIEKAVREGLPPSGPATVLEVGCHAGDGTLSIVLGLQERKKSTIVSTEGNKEWLEATKKVLKHATSMMEIRHVPLLLDAKDDFGAFLDKLQKDHGISMFDAVTFESIS